MKVASKIILVACLAFLPILGAHTWLSLEREEALFRSDSARDLSVLASYLREMTVSEWNRSGADGVSAVLRSASQADRRVRLKWRSPPLGTPGLGEQDGSLVWVEPVVIDGTTVGEIVLTEPLAPMYAYLRTTLLRLAILTLLLFSAGLLMARLLGVRLIGRRLHRLVEFAAKTGSGELGQGVDVGGRDEIARLGWSLGTMSEALARARLEAERLDQERLAMLQHLRHADRLASLGRLAGSVAHELGTPLNVVMGHANRIFEGTQAPTETKESASTIHRQVRRMEATIRDILGFVKEAPGKQERIDPNRVAASVCDLLRPLARQRGVLLEVVEAAAPVSVWGREVPLEQALSNLVSNAIDASPDGGRVVLSVARESRVQRADGKPQPVIVTRVQDEGPGVAEADIDHLFEPFYTSKADGQGTGLGLWLADGIVRDHGGSIEVENCSDGGACFTIVLPESEPDGSHG